MIWKEVTEILHTSWEKVLFPVSMCAERVALGAAVAAGGGE